MTAFPKYERYKDSGVEWLGDVPEHWEVERAFSVFNERVETGHADAALPNLNITIGRGVQVEENEGARKKRLIEDLNAYKRAKEGDIAYNTMRMWQGTVGDVPVDGLVSPAYVVAKPIKPLNSRFYSYLFRTETFQTETNRHSYGIVSDRNRLYWLGFKNIALPIPSLADQDRIVAFLDRKTAEIDTLIAKKKRQIELLDEQKAILINRAVTRGIVNSEFGMRNESLSSSSHSTFTTHNSKFAPFGIEWIGEIPEHWEVKRIGHLGRVGNGSTPSRSNLRYWDKADYPWLNSGSVNQGVITQADQFVSNLALKECHLPLVRERSIVIAITGQGKTRGTAALLMIPATINQHLAYIQIESGAAIPEFVHLNLTAQYFQLRAISDSGSTKGALTCQDVKEFKIALSPVSEQEALIATYQKIQKDFEVLAAKFNSQIHTLQILRSTLIAHAVTGRIKV